MVGAGFSRAATRRAHELLMSLISCEEFAQLVTHDYLEVRSPSDPRRVYRIPAHGGQVTVYEDGQPRVRLCVLPLRPMPDDDVVAMHKLMIEGDERGYLSRANKFPVLTAESFRVRGLRLDLPFLPS